MDERIFALASGATKWFTKKQNLQPNDLVLMVDEKTSHEQWPIAIIEETYPDKYGNVRQVLVHTGKSKVMRDIRNLCHLEGIY